VPKVEYEFMPEQQQQTGGPFKADLKLQNVGTATATELALLAGPREGIPAELPELGERMTLLPGEVRIWRIRPPSGTTFFPSGDLPLTMTYFGNDKTRAVFEILALRFEQRPAGWGGHNLGSITISFDQRELRRLTRRGLSLWKRPGFQWQTRRSNLPRLLLREDVRLSLKTHLASDFDDLLVTSKQMKSLRERI
jgi:hypothetical protein